MKLSPQGQKAVDEVVQTIVNEDPNLRHWVEKCRRIVGSKLQCERDVFGDCDACDGYGRAGTRGVPLAAAPTLPPSPPDATALTGERDAP